ncbi:MAG: transposase [Fibrobacteres bacterium]|nr:transposase [Fibrobacterota bacterium]
MSLLRQRKEWDGRAPSRSAIYRAVRTRGLQRRGEIATQTTEEARAFAYDHFRQMWTADFLHGPTVREGRKASQKLYLLAIIDDATRFVVHAHFYTTEGIVALVHGLSEAITRFGIPERFYTDNGSAFRTLHLQTIAARLGFTLPHTPAYRPQGRGKIERFFGTLRRQFLDGTIAASRKEWNLKLREWIDRYHHARHETLQATPLERRLSTPSLLRPFPGVADPLKKAFLLEARRKVRRDGTVLLDGATWDVPGALPGEVVNILHAPWVPEQILVGPDHKVARPVDRIVNATRFAKNPIRGNAHTDAKKTPTRRKAHEQPEPKSRIQRHQHGRNPRALPMPIRSLLGHLSTQGCVDVQGRRRQPPTHGSAPVTGKVVRLGWRARNRQVHASQATSGATGRQDLSYGPDPVGRTEDRTDSA